MYKYEICKFSDLSDEDINTLYGLNLGNDGEMRALVEQYNKNRSNYRRDLTITICRNRLKKIIGWATIYKNTHIGVFVHPRYRKKGIGSTLVEMMVDNSKNRQIICSPWSVAGYTLYTHAAEKKQLKRFRIYNSPIYDAEKHELIKGLLNESKKNKNIQIVDL